MFSPSTILGNLFRLYLLLPGHPAKIRIQNWLGNCLFPKGINLKNKEGVIFLLPANDWITRTIIEEKNYEATSLKLATQLTASGGVFIDVGANFGLYTCMLCSKNKNLKAYSIDPNYKIIPWLVQNIKLNAIEKQTQIINSAVADSFRLLSLSQPAQDNIGTTTTSLPQTTGYTVLSCSLEYILQSNNLTGADLVKIDIEGSEFSVFENFPFEKYKIKNILMEFNFLSQASFATILSFFWGKGFELLTIEGNRIEEGVAIPENNIWIVNKAA